MIGIRRGEIYLANLGNIKDNDIGKIRPVLVFQNDFLNKMIQDSKYQDVVIIPLSSQIRNDDFSLFIKKRDNLEKDSIIACNTIKMIHSKRLLLDRGILTKLTNDEILSIENILYNLFGCNNR